VAGLKEKTMNSYRMQIITTTGLVVSLLTSFNVFANHNGESFSHVSNHKQGRVNEHKQWKSGSNFKLQNNMNFSPDRITEYEARRYALTEPQRKSVNPWTVKNSINKNSFSAAKDVRPWGGVPEKYSRKKVKKHKKIVQSNNYPHQQQRNVNSFGQNNLLFNQNRNPSLVPIVGGFPTYTNSRGFSPLYADPGYGAYGAFPYFTPNQGYLSPYRW